MEQTTAYEPLQEQLKRTWQYVPMYIGEQLGKKIYYEAGTDRFFFKTALGKYIPQQKGGMN